MIYAHQTSYVIFLKVGCVMSSLNLQVAGPNLERISRPKRPSAINMFGNLSSRVNSIGGLSARVTPTNSSSPGHNYQKKPRPAFGEPPSQAFSVSSQNHSSEISSNSSVQMGASDVNKERNSNGHKTEVSPRVSPCVFKNGPEVPRTIYPGLDDVPDCDGRLLL